MADPSMPHTSGPPGQHYANHNKLTPAIKEYFKHKGTAVLQNKKHLRAFLGHVYLHAGGLNKACLSMCKCAFKQVGLQTERILSSGQA